jgi:glycerate 2-kinase
VTRIVVAPASFKGGCRAAQAADALAEGLKIVAPDVDVARVPVADGGEGTLDAILAATAATRHRAVVSDPLGRPIEAAFGLLPNGMAIIELAEASGYERLRDDERNPERTSTRGTGELIRAALDRGARRLLLTVGGSATNDGGMGLLAALGVRFLTADGRELDGRGLDMARVARIDLSTVDPRLPEVPIEIACDVDSPLVGPRGAARVFGPQKGAAPDAVERLEQGLVNLAARCCEATDVDVRELAGAGAAGGAAGGAVAILKAVIRPGAPMILETLDFEAHLADAALCITGEGRIDTQTATGKAPAAVAATCRAAGVACVAVCGELALEPAALRALGFSAAIPINRTTRSLDERLAATRGELVAAGAAIGGLWFAGRGELNF